MSWRCFVFMFIYSENSEAVYDVESNSVSVCVGRQAVSLVAASPVSHEPQSTIAQPVKVHQFQLLPWPPAFIQPGGGGAGGDGLTVGPGGPCPVDYGPDPGEVPPPPPFQRLLSSFGHLSDDEDDDAVVSVDEPPSGRGGGGLALGRHAAAVGYLHPGGGSTVDRLLGPGGTGTFTGTAAQHGILC